MVVALENKVSVQPLSTQQIVCVNRSGYGSLVSIKFQTNHNIKQG